MNDAINFLPAEFLRRTLLRTRLAQWSVVWAAVATAAGGGGLWKLSTDAALRQRVRDLEAQCAPLRELARESRQIQDRLQEISGRQSLLAQLDRAQHPLHVLGVVSQCAAAADKRLYVERLQLSPIEPASTPTNSPNTAAGGNPPVPASAPAAKAPVARTRLTLGGLAADDLAVARFMTGLRNSQIFERIDLNSSSRVPHPQGHARRYEIDGSL